MKTFNRYCDRPFIRALTAFLLFYVATSCAELSVVIVPSVSMGKDYCASIVLPSSYVQSHKRYSVIYLLHGFGGDHTSWPHMVPLQRHADSLQVIMVCPFGDNSWYINSPFAAESLFETYIFREVCPFIDSAYRTRPCPEGRAIIGVSMGGHGAISLLAKHPEIFSAACSIAGIMDLTAFPGEWELNRVLGPLEKNRELWTAQSCVSMARRLKKSSKQIILDCGSADFALKGNCAMDSLMRTENVAHSFYTRRGTHDWRYVKAHAPRHLVSVGRSLLPPE